MSKVCDLCGKFSYNRYSQLCGHRRVCTLNYTRNFVINEQIDFLGLQEQEMAAIEEYQPFQNEFNGQLPIIFEHINEYFQEQKKYLSSHNITHLETGFPILLDGRRAEKANIRIYLELAVYVTSCIAVSAPESDELLHVLKRITHMNGREIPIPARFSTIIANILKYSDSLRSHIVKSEFSLSEELFPPQILQKIPKSIGVVTNIISLIGKNRFYKNLQIFCY